MHRRFLAALLFTAFSLAAPAADAPAERFASEARALLDRDHEAKTLEIAGDLVRKALEADPESTPALVQHVRQRLLAGTTDKGVKPEPLEQARQLVDRLTYTRQPTVEVLAVRAHVYNLLGDSTQSFRALRMAEMQSPNDPWIHYYWSEHNQRFRSEPDLARLESAIQAGLPDRWEAYAAHRVLVERYAANNDRAKAEATVKRWMAARPEEAFIPGNYSRTVMTRFQDFQAGESYARMALAVRDYPHARQSLSFALYAQWADAARKGSGLETLEPLFKRADQYDPGGRNLPECLADYPPFAFVFERLASRRIGREQMQRC